MYMRARSALVFTVVAALAGCATTQAPRATTVAALGNAGMSGTHPAGLDDLAAPPAPKAPTSSRTKWIAIGVGGGLVLAGGAVGLGVGLTADQGTQGTLIPGVQVAR